MAQPIHNPDGVSSAVLSLPLWCVCNAYTAVYDLRPRPHPSDNDGVAIWCRIPLTSIFEGSRSTDFPSDLGRQWVTVCVPGKTERTQPIDQKSLGRFCQPSDAYVCQVNLRNVDDVFVFDQDPKPHQASAHPLGTSLAIADGVREAQIQSLRPIADADLSSYRKPLVVVCHPLLRSEVSLFSGPWPDIGLVHRFKACNPFAMELFEAAAAAQPLRRDSLSRYPEYRRCRAELRNAFLADYTLRQELYRRLPRVRSNSRRHRRRHASLITYWVERAITAYHLADELGIL